MFDNTNHYTLRSEISEGVFHYYVAFEDGQGVHYETEVTLAVYAEFQCFVKQERNLRRSDERHIEQLGVSEGLLYQRALYPPKSVEELVFDHLLSDELRTAIQKLEKIQRRRFVLHHEFGLTFEQIAEMEGCSKMAVKHSLDKAKTSITKKIKKYLD